jgi:hypothetical protein
VSHRYDTTTITYRKGVPVDRDDPNRVPTASTLQGPDNADVALTARGGIAAKAEQAHGLLMMRALLLLVILLVACCRGAVSVRRNILRHGGSWGEGRRIVFRSGEGGVIEIAHAFTLSVAVACQETKQTTSFFAS